MKDNEARGLVLKTFYDVRHSKGIFRLKEDFPELTAALDKVTLSPENAPVHGEFVNSRTNGAVRAVL
jgi:hypothetical protein